METRQYAVCPVSEFGGFVATDLGLQMFISVADPRNPVEARAMQARVERAHGWRQTLLIDRGRV